MNDLEKYLIPTETPVVVTTRHWASMLKTGAVTAAAFVVGLWMLRYTGDSQATADLAVLIMLGAIGWFGWHWLTWHTEEFVITDRRVLLIDGVLSRRVAIMPLSKVTDLTYRRSIPGRLLGYGAFVVESAGQHQAFNQINFLPSPDRLYQDVSALLFSRPYSVVNSQRNRNRDDDDDYPTTPLPPS
jgi:uncharacterized membrane protein YdbT with pleckstrin-like domain